MENWVYYIEDVGYFITMLSWVCAVVCCAHKMMSWCHACIVFHSVSSRAAIFSPPCPSSEFVPAQTSVLNQGPVRFCWTLQWSGPLCLPGWGLFHASSLSSHYWCPKECCTFPITVLMKSSVPFPHSTGMCFSPGFLQIHWTVFLAKSVDARIMLRNTNRLSLVSW